MVQVRATLGTSCERSLFLMRGSTATYVMNRPSPEHREEKRLSSCRAPHHESCFAALARRAFLDCNRGPPREFASGQKHGQLHQSFDGSCETQPTNYGSSVHRVLPHVFLQGDHTEERQRQAEEYRDQRRQALATSAEIAANAKSDQYKPESDCDRCHSPMLLFEGH